MKMFENTDYRTDGEKTAEGWVVIIALVILLPLWLPLLPLYLLLKYLP